MTYSSKPQMALVLGVTLVAGSVCLAAPASSNPGVPFQKLEQQHDQIQSVVNEIPSLIIITGATEMDLLEQLQKRVTVTAKVDTKACASGLGQCGDPPSSAASSNNDEPVRLFVQVSQFGRGVQALLPAAFEFANPFYPAGGRAVRKCETCPGEWFQDGGNGLYSIFLEPLPASTPNNWQAGEYAAAITVTVTLYDGIPRTGTALVTFDIPPALNVDK